MTIQTAASLHKAAQELCPNYMIKHAQERRYIDGLHLAFSIPGDKDLFTCYPLDDADKTKWLAGAERKGWTRIL